MAESAFRYKGNWSPAKVAVFTKTFKEHLYALSGMFMTAFKKTVISTTAVFAYGISISSDVR